MAWSVRQKGLFELNSIQTKIKDKKKKKKFWLWLDLDHISLAVWRDQQGTYAAKHRYLLCVKIGFF